jgi:PhnB protein
MAASDIYPGAHTVNCYIICKGASEAIAWYGKAFGAMEILRLTMPDGSIAHAEFKIGDTMVMIGEENLEWGAKGPLTLGGSPVGLMIYTPDCDAMIATALAAGAKAERPIEDHFYGDRAGTIIDPWGHKWSIATHKTTMTAAEMQSAMNAWMMTMAGSAQHHRGIRHIPEIDNDRLHAINVAM